MARTAPKGFWRGVPTSGEDKMFLAKVHAAVVAAGGTYVYITSGKRTPKTNTGVANSNHLTGHAMDGYAYVPGKGKIQLGTLLKGSASAYGLRSGDVAGFYKGGPDPEHVDDGSNVNGGKPLPASAPIPSGSGGGGGGGQQPSGGGDVQPTSGGIPTTTDPSGVNLNQQVEAGLQGIQQLPGAPLASPPLIGGGDQTGQVSPAQVGQTWQLIAANGPVSPDTLRLASLASLASNGSTPQ